MKLSFEVFPPKTESGVVSLKKNIARYASYKPDMMTVTHGANGSNVGCQLDILKYISASGIDTCANLTCIHKTTEDVYKFCSELREADIHKILALRGDIQKGDNGTCGDFAHASDLIEYISCFNNNEIVKGEREFEIYAACYPEGHLESEDEFSTIFYQSIKHRNGVNHFISQMCYDIGSLCLSPEISFDRDFIGVMPVLNKESVISMCLKNGCSIPKGLAHIIGKYYDDPDGFEKAGIEYTIKLIEKISTFRPYGIQLFTMNKYDNIKDILDCLFNLTSGTKKECST